MKGGEPFSFAVKRLQLTVDWMLRTQMCRAYKIIRRGTNHFPIHSLLPYDSCAVHKGDCYVVVQRIYAWRQDSRLVIQCVVW